MIFLTEYVGNDGKNYGGQVEANDWLEAEDKAEEKGENVVGILLETHEWTDFVDSLSEFDEAFDSEPLTRLLVDRQADNKRAQA